MVLEHQEMGRISLRAMAEVVSRRCRGIATGCGGEVRVHFAGVTASAAAAVFCLIFVFLPKFQEVDVLGFKAKLLDQKVEEADRLIKRLNHLALAVAAPIYSMIGRHGRLNGGIAKTEQLEMISRIDQALLDAGVQRAEIEEFKREFHFFNIVDIAAVAHKKLGPVLAEMANERRKEFEGHKQPYDAEAQRVLRKVLEAAGPIERIKSDWWDDAVRQPYEGIPDRIEACFQAVPTLKDAEKRHLMSLIEPELRQMREYVRKDKPS